MRDQNSRSFAHLVRGESSSATPAHDIAVCIEGWDGGHRGGGGGRFHCDDNIALGGIGEAEMQISWRTALFSAFSSMDDGI